MDATLPSNLSDPAAPGVPVALVPSSSPTHVTLADGTTRDLCGLGRDALVRLQWEQESTFARRILEAPKGSIDRAEAVRHAYDTVTRIHAAVIGASGKPLVMGLHPRYERMLRSLLQRQRGRGVQPRFFEIGYGSGVLLKRVSEWGFPAAGIEVSPAMYERACRHFGRNRKVDLYVGDFLRDDFAAEGPRYTLVYWNDVFEHIPPDEIPDFLRKIHGLLAPGGQLVTITPNWHTRPWDITAALHPARTEAAGLHLKEYTLREVTRLLREAGFSRVATPLVVAPARAMLCGSGLVGLKCLGEPCLELFPVRAAYLLCRGLGFCETIATKGQGRRRSGAGRRRSPLRESIRLSQEAIDRLRCPACRAELQMAGEEFRCTGDECGKQFPLVGGIPILINEQRSLFTISGFLNQDPTFFKPVGRVRAWLSAQMPTLSHNVAARKTLKQMRNHLLQRSERPSVLVVGGGEVGAGLDALLDDPAIEVIESDVSIGPRVQCICDGHDLPFADASFDGVVIQAVLEHVVDPQACVEEIHRVLKDRGIVYADTPFICQIHGRQFDFTRYTRLGHRRLFRRFRELSSGISSGPGMALGWTARYFLLSFVTSPLARSIVGGLSRLALFWLKYLDYCVLHKPSAVDAAFAFYFLGEKSGEVLPDHDLVRSYRGGF